MNFAERVREFAEEDESLSSTEKVAASEGRRNVLRLLNQLCSSAAQKSQPGPRKACDFEGLYAPSDTAQVAEGSPTLFHRVAELREEHQTISCSGGGGQGGVLCPPFSLQGSRLLLQPHD